ncbi:hypothetical protein PUG81_03645 [Erwiniaceae bacterium L1_54_6]|nr:hypothetical protein [Erwiniaceae bacterium L1_54_6]
MSIVANTINSCVKCIDTHAYTDNNVELKSVRNVITHDNFPDDIILSADGISERFESFNKVIVDHQSVPKIKNQVYEHLEQVATTVGKEKKKEYEQKKAEYDQKVKEGKPVDLTKPPQKDYEFTVLSAITLLFKDRSFSFSELSAIRDLRIYCQKHGEFGENARFMSGDFYGFSIIAAHNVAKQIIIDEYQNVCELNMESLRDIIEAKQPGSRRDENIRKSIMQLNNDIFAWLEGESNELPQILSFEKNKNQAERIFNLKY